MRLVQGDLPRGFSDGPSGDADVASVVERLTSARASITSGASSDSEVSSLDDAFRAVARPQTIDALLEIWTPVLRESRRRWMETEWRAAAVCFGGNAYDTGRFVEAVWRTGDSEATIAAACRMRDALQTQTFATYGDAFHLDQNRKILDDFEALACLDQGVLTAEDPRLQALHLHVVPTIYDLMWDAHIAGESRRACALGVIYIHAVLALGHGPEMALWISAFILAPLGAHDEVLRIFADLPMADATPAQRWRFFALRGASAMESGATPILRTSLDELALLLRDAPYEAIVADDAWADAYVLAVALVEAERPGIAVQEAAQLQLLAHDDRWRKVVSRLHLEAMPHAGSVEAPVIARHVASAPPDALTDRSHHVVDVLAATGDWSGAARVYAAGVEPLWDAPGKLGGEWRRAVTPELPRAGWVWAGRGIGDDILHLQMLVSMSGRENACIYDLDPRLASLAARALPGMRFSSTPRATGPGEVGRAAFWRAREGVPRAFDAFRVTNERLEWLRAGKPVLQGEDIHLVYLRRAGDMQADTAPILRAGTSAQARASEWLIKSDDERLTLCLAWRSGLLDRERRRYFMELQELATLFSLPGVRWIVVQHDLTPDERALIAATPSLSLPEDLDTRNDLEALTALFASCDGVVAPKLSTRDLAAAAGARVLSISLGHAHIEGARIAGDGVTDRVFPRMAHIRENDGRPRQQVIRDVADIVGGWSPLSPAA